MSATHHLATLRQKRKTGSIVTIARPLDVAAPVAAVIFTYAFLEMEGPTFDELDHVVIVGRQASGVGFGLLVVLSVGPRRHLPFRSLRPVPAHRGDARVGSSPS